jgi:hypothetical protein
MPRSALVTGSPARVADVADALERAGFAVTRVEDVHKLGEACAGFEPKSLDSYVQLPRDVALAGPNLVTRVRYFLAEGLLARFEAASIVLPFLAPDASVVLVAGHLPHESETPDDRYARIDLLRVLARAILADCGAGGIKAIVVDFERTPAQIADIARLGSDDHLTRSEVESLPDMSYDDWQREVLSLTHEKQEPGKHGDLRY